MRRIAPALLLCVLIPLHVVDLHKAADAWGTLPQGNEATYVIPGKILKLTSLEFDGLISDFMFLRSLVFYGKTLERTEKPRVKPWEWQHIYAELNAATDLDPYFYDPYNFGQGLLPWEGNMVTDANRLLSKGCSYRTWDWSIPFYIGFNHFYFQHEDALASKFLMEASRVQDAPPILASLATRLAVKGKQTENAIVFLTQLMKTEQDESRRKSYQLRIDALKSILLLENAASDYRQRYGSDPSSINDLVDKHIIKDIPPDPYGGDFYIDDEGGIMTTSNLQSN